MGSLWLLAAYPALAFADVNTQSNAQGNTVSATNAQGIGLTISDQLVLRKPTKPGAIFASADTVSGRSELEVTFEGNAVLRRDGSVINADRLTYNPTNDVLTGVGSVRISKEGTVLLGTELSLKLDTQEGYMNKTAYTLGSLGGRGFAEKIEFLGPDLIRAKNAFYTTCDPVNPDWQLRTDELTLDEITQQGRSTGSKLFFKNQQIAGAPFFFFPLGKGRQSGFLTPGFESNTRIGFGAVAPWYWNIADNRDATFSPRVMSKRGFQLGTELRFLEPTAAGEFRYEFNPRDQVTNSFRWLGTGRLNWQMADWTANLSVKRISDENYLVDYGRSLLASSETRLPTDFNLTRSFGQWNVAVRALTWQNILDAKNSPSYEILPQIRVSTERDIGGFKVATVFDATRFDIARATGKAVGWRAVANPSISYPIQTAGYFITPKISVHASEYSLNFNPDGPTSIQRVLPTFSLDAGLIFDRNTTWRGEAVQQTLEPRIFYVRTPFKDQSKIPVFVDTAASELNFAQLLAENNFVGNDRIADANQLTTMLLSRIIRSSDGAEKLRFAVGQRWYFSEQKVTIAPTELPRSDTRSDILFAAGGNLSSDLAFDAGMQYSVETAKIPRFNASLRYTPVKGNLINLGYRLSKATELDQFDVSWRWHLENRWTVLGRLNYSFARNGTAVTLQGRTDKPGLVEAILGLEYDVDCWTSRFVVQRFVAADLKPTTQLFFQLELKGFGQIGISPFDVLKRNIPGYQTPNEQRKSPSTFFGYE